MPYQRNYSFFKFKGFIEDKFSKEQDLGSYMDAVREIAPRVRTHFFPKTLAKAMDPEWSTWIDDIEESVDVQSDWERIKGLNEARIKDMRPQKGSPIHAFAFHFRLHRYYKSEDIAFAHELDRKFLGGTFEKLFGQPVFSHTLDDFFDAPPLNAPMSYPPYKLKKDVEALLRKDINHGIWLDPHNHHSIPLEGRENEKRLLTGFMDSRGIFSICPVIGPSGAGKTRMISEWMRPYVPTVSKETEWEAGFLVSDGNSRARDPNVWDDWEITKNTLVVINYTYAFDAVVKKISARALSQTTHKVRMIVIDHVLPEMLKNDFLWDNLTNGHQSSLEYFKSIYIAPTVELTAKSNDPSLLRNVVVSAANTGGLNLKKRDPVISRAMAELDRMGQEQGDHDAVRHPLFAALLGQVIRDYGYGGAIVFSSWNRRDLITYYFEGRDARHAQRAFVLEVSIAPRTLTGARQILPRITRSETILW